MLFRSGWAANGAGVAKRARRASMQEMHAREASLHKEIECYFVAGKENPADLYTKEHRDVKHFEDLRDLMVISKEAFLPD